MESVETCGATQAAADPRRERKTGEQILEQKRQAQRRYYQAHREECIARQRERGAKYRAANREKLAAKKREKYAKNKALISAYQCKMSNSAAKSEEDARKAKAREYYHRNREKRLAYQRDYYWKNRESIVAEYAKNRESICKRNRRLYKMQQQLLQQIKASGFSIPETAGGV